MAVIREVVYSDDEIPLSKLAKSDCKLDVTDLTCKVCNWVFTSKACLTQHLIIYTDNHFMYPCCRKPLKMTDDMLQHECISSYFEDSNCNLSEEIFVPVKDGPSSSSEDSVKGSYICSNCPATFHSMYGLEKHNKKFPGQHHFVCDKCGRVFLKESQLQAHICILAVSDKFMCSCLETFDSMKQFRSHIGKRSPYLCCHCKRKCKTVNNLINHIRIHTKEKPFVCEVCEKGFSLKESLRLHMRTHSKEKPYQCAKCSYSCAVKWNLHLHEETHGGGVGERRNKRFLCSICGATFARHHHLTRHTRGHTCEKSFLCKICGKLFKESSYLNKHMAIHRSKSHVGRKCLECSQEFPPTEAYQHHLNTGHFKFICNACHKVFSTKFNLLKHLALHEKHQK